MNPNRPKAALTAAFTLAFITTVAAFNAIADDGHDHGTESTSPGNPALPRFAAVSETFELVGVLDGKRLTLYLDRFDDNTPVTGAKFELEVGAEKVSVAPNADGTYQGSLAHELEPGVIAITTTVVAGNETDILGTDFGLHEAHPADEAHPPPGRKHLAWGTVAAVLAGVALWGGRRVLRTRRACFGSAA